MASANVGVALRFVAGLVGYFAFAVVADVNVATAFLTGLAFGTAFVTGLMVRGSLAGLAFAGGFTEPGVGARTFVASTANS